MHTLLEGWGDSWTSSTSCIIQIWRRSWWENGRITNVLQFSWFRQTPERMFFLGRWTNICSSISSISNWKYKWHDVVSCFVNFRCYFMSTDDSYQFSRNSKLGKLSRFQISFHSNFFHPPPFLTFTPHLNYNLGLIGWRISLKQRCYSCSSDRVAWDLSQPANVQGLFGVINFRVFSSFFFCSFTGLKTHIIRRLSGLSGVQLVQRQRETSSHLCFGLCVWEKKIVPLFKVYYFPLPSNAHIDHITQQCMASCIHLSIFLSPLSLSLLSELRALFSQRSTLANER